MDPLEDVLARELAEEIRSNTKLRHRLGLDEGDESGVVDGEPSTIGIVTKDGNPFFIKVEQG